MRLACQGYGSQYLASMRFDVTTQVGKRSTHADEIIHQDIFRTGLDGPVKFWLARKPREAIRSGVGNDVHLHDPAIHFPSQTPCQFVGEYFRNRIYPVFFISVSADQNGAMSGQQLGKSVSLRGIECAAYQKVGGSRIARFGLPVKRVLLNGGFAGVYQHVRKISPRHPWRFHAADFTTAVATFFLDPLCLN